MPLKNAHLIFCQSECFTHVLFSLKVIVSLAVFPEFMQNELELRFVLEISVNGRKVSIDAFEGDLGQSHHSLL